MGKYAADTKVSTGDSLAEIDRILTRYGATGFNYGRDDEKRVVGIMFRMNGRFIKFVVPIPDPDDRAYKKIRGGSYVTNEFSPDKYEQAVKQRYRALVLGIKARLESVESGIEDFETAFMAHIVLPDGQTVGEFMKPQVEQAYLKGDMPLLLPMLGAGG